MILYYTILVMYACIVYNAYIESESEPAYSMHICTLYSTVQYSMYMNSICGMLCHSNLTGLRITQ